jgi:Concanavalin A-like lectin/glucanases superfamily
MNKFLMIVFAIFTTISTFAQAPVNGLLAYYPFNGNANDESGNSNHGSAQNGLTFGTDRFGNPGKAASFDGIDDYIQIDDPNGNLGGFNTFTFSFWINTNFQELNWGLYGLISKKPSYDFSANVYGGGHGYQFYTNLNNNYFSDPPSSWQNITISQNNFGRKIYLNGLLIEFNQSQNQPILFSTNKILIGADDFFGTARWHYKGSIDDFRIYNRALSNVEIEALNGISPQAIDVSKILVAHYKLDGNTNDASGNSNHGTAHNGVSFGSDRFGRAGMAASFDGIDDYIDINHIKSGRKITVNFWMKNIEECPVINQDCPYRQLFYGENSNNLISAIEANITIGLSTNTTFGEKSTMYLDIKNTGGLVYFDFPPEKWNMFTFVYNSTTRISNFYLNGEHWEKSSWGGISNNEDFLNGIFNIGKSSPTQEENPLFKGKIDEFRIYNGELTESEVLALYNSENSGVSLTTAMRLGGGLSTLIVGTGYNLTASLKNNGSTSWVGDVYLKVKSGTPMLISSNNVISAGSTYNMSSTFNPQTSQIGQNVIVELLTKQSTNDFIRASVVNGTVNPVVVNIEAASTVPVVKVPFIRLNQSEISLGATIQIIGGNFEPNTQVTIGSSPDISGATYPAVTVAADGSINTAFTIPLTFMEKYLTILGRDLQSNNPGALIVVKQPNVYENMLFLEPNQSQNTNGNIYLGFGSNELKVSWKDKMKKKNGYLIQGVKRQFNYVVQFEYASSGQIVELGFKSGYELLDSSPNINRYFTLIDIILKLGTGGQTSANGYFKIVDQIDPTRFVKSQLINIVWNNPASSFFNVKKVWDASQKFIDPTDGFPLPSILVPINGIVADSIARFYFEVNLTLPANSPNVDKVELTLIDPDDINNTDPTWLGKVMFANQSLVGQYTEEANVANQSNSESLGLPINNKYYFWYVAPDDFQRQGKNYANFGNRIVNAKFKLNLSGLTTQVIQEIPIIIARPPLILVHGLSGDENTWAKFPLINSDLFMAPPKPINMFPGGSFFQNAKGLVGKNPFISKENSIQTLLMNFNQKEGYVAKRVDYVCHSMGGCMLRMGIEKSRNDFYVGFNSNDNFKNYNKGFINKFITINTPHNGSPIADMVTSLAPNLTIAIRTGLTANFKATESEKFKDYGFEKINSFIVPSDDSTIPFSFKASDAVQNLQTNVISGDDNDGVRFKRTNLNAHMISSDIFFSENRPAQFDNQLKIMDTGIGFLYLFNQIRSIANSYKNFVLNPSSLSIPSLYDKYNAITGPKKLWNSFTAASHTNLSFFWTFSSGLTSSTDELLKVYGNWNLKYADFMYNSDLVVPYMSQTANLGSAGNNVTTISSTADEILDIDQIKRFSHLGITDQFETGLAVKLLLNTAISSNKFGSIPPNTNPTPPFVSNLPQTNTFNKSTTTNSVNTLNTSYLYLEKYDTTRIKILNPITGSQILQNNVIQLRIKLKNKLNLVKINAAFGGTIITDTLIKDEYIFNISNKYINLGKNYIVAEAIYSNFDSLYVAYDSIYISHESQLNKVFIVEPKVIEKGLEQKFIPKYYVLFENFIAEQIDNSKLSIVIANPACLIYNTLTGQFKGLQKGETQVYFTYDGIFKDTMYVAVAGGGLPHPQTIATSTLATTSVCTGQTIQVPFVTAGGTFDSGNQFFVQLSDKFGDNFKTLETSGTSSPLSIKIPNDLEAATGYKIRVVSTNVPVIGTESVTSLTITAFGTAPSVTASKTTFWAGDNLTLTASNCPSGQTIKWSDGQTTNQIVITPLDSKTYTAVCTNGTCETENSEAIYISKNYCPTDVNRNTISLANDSVIKALYSIEASNKIIGVGKKETFEAPIIILNPGFETSLGVIFTVRVGGCSN